MTDTTRDMTDTTRRMTGAARGMVAGTAGAAARRGLAWAGLVVAGGGLALLPPPAALAAPSPSPSASGDDTVVTKAGTSFLTAVPVAVNQQVKLGASTGDYLYWSFRATAGQTSSVSVIVSMPPADTRHGAETWTVDVFDGLRRRQACTSGAQSPQAAQSAGSVELSCTLREVRAWAEPWSGDPLPGTYYLRLAAADLPEQDLGLPVVVDLTVHAQHSGDPAPEGGSLREPLAAATRPGKVLPSVQPSASASEEADWLPDAGDWLPAASSRWAWTIGGGVLAALAGAWGFSLTRRPWHRRHPRYQPGPAAGQVPGAGQYPPAH